MTGATAANTQALNAAAKEFVPHCDAAATLRQAPSTEQPKKDAAQAQSHLHHLRVNAPAFVPRASGHHPATPDRPSERPAQSSSSIAASVSGSSTSGASRTADCCAPEEGDDEEGEAGVGACGESSAGGCCECGAEDGECGHSSNAGEEGDALAGGGAYGGGALEQLPYRWEGGVPYNGAVYYDAAFVDPYGLATYGYLTDGSFEASQCQAYYDSEAAAAAAAYYAMMGAEELEGEGEGASGTSGSTAAGTGAGAGGAASAETAESQLVASDYVEGLAASLEGSDKALAAGEARELLELFFPHYAGAALARLLARTGGDLAAAFAELAALERQAAAERAAERAAAAAGASTSGRGAAGQQAGKGKGATAAGGKGQGQPAQQGQAGKGKGGAFKLDPEAFPTLAGSPTKHPQQQHTPSKKHSGAAAVKDAREVQQEQKQQQQQQPQEGHAKANRPTEAQEDAVEAKAEAAADAHPAASTDGDGKAAPAPVPATAPTPARAAPKPGAQASSINPAKPNFAAMLRNSVSADVNLAGSASKPAAGKAAVGGAKQTQPAAAAKGSAPAAAGVAVPRVATGAAAAAQYGEERAEAAVLARARNAFFMQATLAFLSGDKALARQLGRKGRAANEAMKAAHAAAAARIFAARNAHVAGRQQQQGGGKRQAGGKTEQQGKGGGKAHPAQPQGTGGKAQSVPSEGCVRFVDLHGLHVTEAVAALEAQIEAARAAGCSHLRVCTGTGSHTKGAKTPARLPAAVADTLLAHHITFRTLQPGLLEGSL